jgi:hypothetical protein
MKIDRVLKIANSIKDSEGNVSINNLAERLNSISFWELLNETSKIQIPIIQRDFAQGRENEKSNTIREVFLKSLIMAMESEKGQVELDFIYGDVNNGVFMPLDGQQRLTTLYLLHWFIALKTKNLSENKNQFRKFTYETRISSREFCNELAENGENLGEGNSISEKIIDSSWFFLSWNNDPTIKAMLVMLNSIENRLEHKDDNELKDFWMKLTSGNPPITFHFKQLNDIGLTDDLYIKMNARGKELTVFENFKARFEKHIKEHEFEKELLLSETNKEQWLELTEKTFSYRIDTVWTDLFWKHRGDDNLVDNEFIKFIAGIAINSYAENIEIFYNEEDEEIARMNLEKKKEKKITDDAIKQERIVRRIELLHNAQNKITPEDFQTKKSFDYLKKCFDLYSNKEFKYDELKPENLILWNLLESKKVKINSEKEIENNFFIDLVKDKKTEYKQRVLFYAQTKFLFCQEPFNNSSFVEWIRVVRNVVQNFPIDKNNYIEAIGWINELSAGCADIYSFLNTHDIKSSFASKQVKEEILKANIIQTDNIRKYQIFKVEDNKFLKGEIAFLLEFATGDLGFDYQYFIELSDNFLRIFDSQDDLLRIALLTQDNYPIWDGYTYSLSANRYSLLNSQHEWKEALRSRPNKLMNALHKLLDCAINVEGDRDDKLKTIINNSALQNDYRDLIISNMNFLKSCYHKRFCINEDGTTLYLLESTRVVGENYRKFSKQN